MMKAANTSAVIQFDKIKFLEKTFNLAISGIISGGTKDHFAFTQPFVEYDERLSELKQLLLNDAQASGRLLISVPKNNSIKLLDLLLASKVLLAHVIGEVSELETARIFVR